MRSRYGSVGPRIFREDARHRARARRASTPERDLDSTTAALVRAAEARGIPWEPLNPSGLLELGHGVHRHDRRESEGASDHRLLVVGGELVAAAGPCSPHGEAWVDRTDQVHSDNRAIAERAASAVGLGVAGVDLRIPDVTRSHRDVGGGIVALDPSPDLGIHMDRPEGPSRDVAGAIIDRLFPEGHDGRIPIAAVTGTHGTPEVCRMIAWIQCSEGRRVGLATRDGISIGGSPVADDDPTCSTSARMILRDATVECAVLEKSTSSWPRERSGGLSFRRCAVGAVLDMDGERGEPPERQSPERRPGVAPMIVSAATEAIVLNADEPRCLALVEGASAGRLILVSENPESERVAEHLREGGLAVVIVGRDPAIVVCDGFARTRLELVRRIPAVEGGGLDIRPREAAFAAAVSLGLDVSVDDIRRGLVTFPSSAEEAARWCPS